MSIPAELLDQAENLIGRGGQADLRRAVSSAYYALFHLVVQTSADLVSPDPKFRALLARVPSHQEVKKACQLVQSSGGWQGRLKDAAGDVAIPAGLQLVCDVVVSLQQARHRADYDLAVPFTPTEARAYLQAAKDAAGAWEQVCTDRNALLFLLLVQFGDRWQR